MPISRRMPWFRAALLWLGDDDAWEVDGDAVCARVDRLAGHLAAGASPPEVMRRPLGVYVVSGGDPFAQPDDLARVLRRCAEHRMTTEVITPAPWATDEAAARERLAPLEGLLHLLTIRTSASLIARHGIAPVAWAATAARHLDMNLSVLCHVGLGHPLPRELFALEALNDDTSILRFEPPPGVPGDAWAHEGGEATGKAPEAARDDAFALDELPRRRCRDLLSLAITPDGDAFPCARGMGCTPLRLGNVDVDPVADVVARAVRRPSLRRLRLEGPGFLYDACRAEAPAALGERYVDPCAFHRSALAHPVLRDVIDRAMRRADAAGDAADTDAAATFPVPAADTGRARR